MDARNCRREGQQRQRNASSLRLQKQLASHMLIIEEVGFDPINRSS
jgi:hypothetical protein